MGNLCFLTDLDMPNYLVNSSYYKYRNPPLPFPGKYIHSNYLYWILKNNNIKNIKLLKTDKDINPDDILFFHYNFKDKINFNKDYVKLQIVSDKPRVDGINGYLSYDPTNKQEDEYILYEPLPLGLSIKTPSFSPRRFHSNSAVHWVPKYFSDKLLFQKHNIEISYEHNRHVSAIDFDVFFFMRDTACLEEKNNDGTKKHNIVLFKNASRLFQAWHMEVPSIFCNHSAMSYIKKSELDYLEANTKEEFIECCLRLKTDKDLFYAMIENAKKRKNEFNNSVMIEQINNILKSFNSQLLYE
jgi:hypothetical protein